MPATIDSTVAHDEQASGRLEASIERTNRAIAEAAGFTLALQPGDVIEGELLVRLVRVRTELHDAIEKHDEVTKAQ